jgi:cysteinyl-tRNA synthetase
VKRHDPFAIRLLFLQTGYRKPMNFTEESIAAAKGSLDKLVSVFKRAESAELEAAIPGRRVVEPAKHREALLAHLDDDMNTAGALGILHDLAGDLLRYDDLRVRDEGLAVMREAFAVFGIEPALDRERPVEFDDQFVARLRHRLEAELQPAAATASRLNGESPEAAIEAVIAARSEARQNKDFALGDRIRAALAAEGIVLKDSKDGTTWTVAGA